MSVLYVVRVYADSTVSNQCPVDIASFATAEEAMTFANQYIEPYENIATPARVDVPTNAIYDREFYQKYAADELTLSSDDDDDESDDVDDDDDDDDANAMELDGGADDVEADDAEADDAEADDAEADDAEADDTEADDALDEEDVDDAEADDALDEEDVDDAEADDASDEEDVNDASDADDDADTYENSVDYDPTRIAKFDSIMQQFGLPFDGSDELRICICTVPFYRFAIPSR